jgi:sigma-E factor negative regulatory protein RseB
VEILGIFEGVALHKLALSAVILCAVSGTALAECEPGDTEALNWLDRMSHSLRETSYSGVFTYQNGSAVQTMRISHSVRGNVESEHLTRLTGAETRVVRTRHPLDCIHPGHKLVRIGQTYQGAGNECGLAAHYRLQMAGSRRIAGRDAVLMNVLPRDQYRYGYQIALDRATGLLLKSQTVAEDGKVLERFQFADVSIGMVHAEGTRVEVIHEAAHPHGAKRAPVPASSRGWTVRWLPAGFMMTDDVEHTVHNRTYTDGLATFSVFVEPLPRLDSPGAGQARQGGTTVYTRGLLISGAPALVTVLGEVPVNAARRVADSVAWSNVAAQ